MSESKLARWIAENNPYAYEFAKERLEGKTFYFAGPASTAKIGCKLNEQSLRDEWSKRAKTSTARDETKKLGQEILDALADVHKLPIEIIQFIEDEWLPHLESDPTSLSSVLQANWVVYPTAAYASHEMQKQHSKIHANSRGVDRYAQTEYIKRRLVTRGTLVIDNTSIAPEPCVNRPSEAPLWPCSDTNANNPTTDEETNIMSTPITFTTVKYITVGSGGQQRDISKVSLDELFSLIEQTEAEIARLEAIKKKPKALQARIEDLQAAIDELAAEADSR